MSDTGPPPAYGGKRLVLLYHDLRDRLAGHKARANARWGWVHPPPGRGRLIWLRAGASRTSVRLAADLLAAIRQTRQDVRLVLSFESDYPELYTLRLQGLKKIAVGYGHCDTPGTVRRIFRHLDPFAVIAVGETPGPRFLDYLASDYHGHSLAFQMEAPLQRGHFELACPPYGVNPGTACVEHEQACDMHTLLVQAQVEPSLGGILRGNRDSLRLLWLGGIQASELDGLRQAWHAHPLSDDAVLCLSPDTDASLGEIAGLQPFSQWPRTAVTPGTLMLMDEARWLGAVAASADAIHLLRAERPVLWQALAGGAPLSLGPELAPPPLPELQNLPRLKKPAELFDHWQTRLANPLAARRQGDQARRLFWQARRQAEQVSRRLLQRIYQW